MDRVRIAESLRQLQRVAESFEEGARHYEEWAPDQCARHLEQTCNKAGVLVHPLVTAYVFELQALPEWLFREPTGKGPEGQDQRHHDFWWMAFVRWMEFEGRCGFDAAAKCRETVHNGVFQQWRPGESVGRSPYLNYHLGLCKHIGAYTCAQSARAITELLRRVLPRDKAWTQPEVDAAVREDLKMNPIHDSASANGRAIARRIGCLHTMVYRSKPWKAIKAMRDKSYPKGKKVGFAIADEERSARDFGQREQPETIDDLVADQAADLRAGQYMQSRDL